jgi:hypothetical protein
MRKIFLLLALLSVIVFSTSCQKAEEVTVEKYFQAIAHKDTDTMSTLAYVPKLVEYKAFEVLSIDEPVTKPLELPVLRKKLTDLERGKTAQVAIVVEKTEDYEDLEYELEETRRSSKKAELRKKIKELKAEIEEETQKVKNSQLNINKTKKEIDREESLVALSTGFKENLEMFTGETLTNKVTVKVTLQNDEVKDYIFLLRKDTLKLEGKERPGRLIIVKFMTVDEYEKTLKEEAAVEEKTEEVSEAEPATEEKTEGE